MNVRQTPYALLLSSLAALSACASPDRSLEDDPGGTVDVARVDAIFADYASQDGPGCAVAVSQDGQTTLTRAYGMANLEYDVPNTAETVFEPGSVSKQFTAAATIMLALDGRIALDDDIREYFPELPDYGEPITIDDLIHHTSGLRDWGSIAGIEGWPRTTRAHTHAQVLDIASRQEALNYPPGEHYSYTNTGYNLQAMLVERVTGKTFQEFSQERIFGPLGMTHTQWRDDYQEVVKNRSVGYIPDDDDGWRMLMPFENVHGNGGLLTTVGDLLKFTHNLDTGDVGGPEFIEAMHRRGVLDSGDTISYASGLFVGEYRGVREVQHSGGTAAYRGFLTRFPDHGLAVSIMCNAGNANPGRYAHEVAELYLEDSLQEEPSPVEGRAVSAERLSDLAGTYREPLQGQALEIAAGEGVLRMQGLELTPVSETRFENAVGVVLDFAPGGDPAAGPTIKTPVSDAVRLERVEPFAPAAEELAEYVGTYASDEAEATYRIEVREGALALVDRYGEARPLRARYRDGFAGVGGMIVFRRDPTGRVSGLSVRQGRVWDLRFRRID